MNVELKEQLIEYGASVDEAIKRFMGKEDLYEKFVFKFLSDQSYHNLNEHLDAENYEEAFKDVHTMKGVAANLGLDPMGHPLVELTELLRNKTSKDEVDTEQVNLQREQLTTQYESFKEILARFE